MHKIFATVVFLLCLALVAGYMSTDANAATSAADTSAAAPAAKNSASKKKSTAAKSKTASAKKAGSKTATKKSAHARSTKRGNAHAARRSSVHRVAYAPAKPSVGESLGLNKTPDALDLHSNSALVIDRDSGAVLYEKNPTAVLPIASITKLMTAMVVLDAQLPLDEEITIDRSDVDTEKGTRSRLALGTTMTRRDALHLALMASENRAAAALGRNYPGGILAFVTAMNAKATQLGLGDTHYVDSSGLSPQNRSSARDLAHLVNTAYEYPLIRELSTSTEYSVQVGRRQVAFHTTNRLLQSAEWDIGLQKTGYISEAGRCLVMEATIEGRHLVLVLLDSWGKYSRIGDAGRIRAWLQSLPPAAKTLSANAETPQS